jgi:hypothetical protein
MRGRQVGRGGSDERINVVEDAGTVTSTACLNGFDTVNSSRPLPGRIPPDTSSASPAPLVRAAGQMRSRCDGMGNKRCIRDDAMRQGVLRVSIAIEHGAQVSRAATVAPSGPGLSSMWPQTA